VSGTQKSAPYCLGKRSGQDGGGGRGLVGGGGGGVEGAGGGTQSEKNNGWKRTKQTSE
jgi:hypothetical protein